MDRSSVQLVGGRTASYVTPTGLASGAAGPLRGVKLEIRELNPAVVVDVPTLPRIRWTFYNDRTF